MQPQSLKSADRAMHHLEIYAEHPAGLTMTDICERTGWPKSSTLALLRTMQTRQFLESTTPDGRYQLGPRVAYIGSAFLANLDLVRQGSDIVRTTSRACDETVHLAVLRDSDVLYIAKEEGGGHMRMVSMVGRRIPAHGTGVGKVLLASLSDAEIDALYPVHRDLPRCTDLTITSRPEFIQRLARIRKNGYGFDSGESTVGVQCLAAPVLDHRAHTIAAMSISVPEPRFTPDRLPALFDILLEGTRHLSVRMGCPPEALPALPTLVQEEIAHGIR